MHALISALESGRVKALSIEDLRNRPAFRAPVNPIEHKLTEVLSDYFFEREAPCGLSTCKQRHLRGFLVRTESGIETNIGHVCGRRHFGEDFDVASSRFRRAEDHREALARALTLIELAPSVIERIDALVNAPFGVRWVYALRDSLRSYIGSAAFGHMVLRARREDYQVVRVEELSVSAVRKAMRETRLRRDQVQYKTDLVGRISAMDWLWWDFRAELLNGVSEPLRELPKQVIASMDTKQLRMLLKPLAGWENRLQISEHRIADARKFIELGNLRIADAALHEFFKAKPDEYKPLLDWIGSGQGKALSLGGSNMLAETELPKPKPISKGKARKLRRHHK